MSTDKFNNDDEEDRATKQVTDDEGTVDEKVKNRILNARERVDEREDAVFVQSALDSEVRLNRQARVGIWATSVKQYLRTIEPLLQSDDIDNSDYYYWELPIIEREVTPPDGLTRVISGNDDKEEKIHWSMFYNDAVDTTRLIIDNPLFGTGFQPPEPKTIKLEGLRDVIETNGISVSWDVPLNPRDFGPQQRIAQPVFQKPLQKEWLEFAVRQADQFLQQAGIGLEIGHQETDDPDDDPF